MQHLDDYDKQLKIHRFFFEEKYLFIYNNIPYNNGVKWSWSVLLTSAPASINIQAISANVASLSGPPLFTNDNDDEEFNRGGDRLKT